MLSGSRTRLDSIVYWSVFFFIALFITYFLNSMIRLTSTEDSASDNATLAGYHHQTSKLHRQYMEKKAKEGERVNYDEDLTL